jgi:hypothetical protein
VTVTPEGVGAELGDGSGERLVGREGEGLCTSPCAIKGASGAGAGVGVGVGVSAVLLLLLLVL